MFSIGLAVGLLLAILIVYKLLNLVRHVNAARKVGLPYVVTPILETEVIGLVFTPVLRWIYHDYLLAEKGWPRWCRFMVKDWAWEDRRRAHDEYGEVFLVVAPEGIICYSADAAMGYDVMNRREFIKPRDKMELLEPYGPNVATAEGKTYQFHVRVTAPPFSDTAGANDLVWSETLLQTRLLISSWDKKASLDLQRDINALTLAVISFAGYGKRVDWTSSSTSAETIPSGYTMSFLKAIQETVDHMVAILLLPKWLMRLIHLREAAEAHSQFDRYLREIIRTEKQNFSENKNYESKAARGNLLTSVLRASALEGASGGKATDDEEGKKRAFTEDEVMGNISIFLMAGYETTANAILYGLIVLAIRPDLQDKVTEEVDRIHAEAAASGRKELTYADDYPKLTYTFGFMYETLRLFPAATLITKMITHPTQILVSSPSSFTEKPTPYLLPADCRVYLNAPAIHYAERYWPSPLTLDPSRWRDSPNVIRDQRGSFLTFADGSRACLGRKFAQAEFVAFLAVLLREYRVTLAEGMDARMVEKDIYLRCAGKITLAPLEGIKLGLERRRE
ncbi:hypothetical protein MMC30_001098 [Trapelia coarctata]|nr:hypothetical protein [Trapelia coarctata]